ncbi:MAG: response regulator transcription factor [Saprospiraceae bacterium]|nr:response regulator transcription factor [Lewinella sp.]
MIRVILFEDNQNFREALTDAFEDSDKVFLTQSFPNATKAVDQIHEYQPDVVLMDIEMPGISGLDAMTKIQEASPETKVMIQTQFEDEHRIFVALCRGAWGYALKSDPFDRLEDAIEEVHKGGGYFSPAIAAKVARFFTSDTVRSEPEYVDLTEREKEVLTLLTKAMRSKEIATKLFLSTETVNSHLKHIYKKLHVNSRAEAIVRALENKLI